MTELVNVFATDVRKRIKKEVPTIEGAWVEFYDDFLAGEVQKLGSGKMSEEEKSNRGYEFIRSLIADWNFSGPDEKKLEITVENIRKLPVKVQTFLAEAGTDVFKDAIPKELRGS